VLGLLFSLNVLSAIDAIFGVVGGGLKHLAADGAQFCGVVPENLCFQRLHLLVLQKHMPEEFAVDGVRDALRANMLFAVIQQEAVIVIIVAAVFAD